MGIPIRSAIVHPNLASAPASPVAGMAYWDTTKSLFRVYDGAKWITITAAALVLGKGGTMPAATSTDTADFWLPVPFDLTLRRLKAVLKTVPTATTTLQIRRSTDSGATFADAFGTVSVASSAHLGTGTPTALDVNEGDILNFSLTAGNGSGADLTLQVIGTPR